MLRSIIVILLFAFVSGCVTYQKCVDKFHIVSDSSQSIIYRDTIIPIIIHGTDTVYAYATIKDTIIVHSGTAHGQSYVVHDTLKMNIWSTDTLIKVKLDSAIKVINNQKTQIIVVREKAKAEKMIWQVIAGLGIIFLIVLVPRVLSKK